MVQRPKNTQERPRDPSEVLVENEPQDDEAPTTRSRLRGCSRTLGTRIQDTERHGHGLRDVHKNGPATSPTPNASDGGGHPPVDRWSIDRVESLESGDL